MLSRVSSAPAELVSICEKAMSREKGGRYRTVLALAEDIQAFLDNRVVLAHQSGALAEARKWVQRNRVLANVVLLALLLTIGGSISFAIMQARATARVSASLREANEARARESEARLGESAAKDAALETLAESYANAGVSAPVGDAHLWFAKAATISKEERALLAHRTRAHAWSKVSSDVIRAFKVGLNPSIAAVHDGRYLLVISRGSKLIDVDTGEEVPANIEVDHYWSWGGDLVVMPRLGVVERMPNRETAFTFPTLHLRSLRSAAFSRDDRWLALMGSEGFSIWDTAKGEMRWRVKEADGAPIDVASLHFAPASTAVAVLTKDSRWTVFDLPESGQAVPRFPWQPGSELLGFSSDGRLVGALTGAAEVTWRRADSGELQRVDEDCPKPKLSPDGSRLLCIGRDSPAILLDVLSGERVAEIPLSSRGLEGHFTDETGSFFLDAFYTRDGVKYSEMRSPLEKGFRAAVSMRGRWMAVSQTDGLVRILRVPNPQGRGQRLVLVPSAVSNVALNREGTVMVPSGSAYIRAGLTRTQALSVPECKLLGPVLEHGGAIMTSVFSPDGELLITGHSPKVGPERNETMWLDGGRGGLLSIWNWKTGERKGEPIPLPSEPRGLVVHKRNPSLVFGWCANGEFISVDIASRSVRLHDAYGKLAANGHGNLGGIAMSPDGRYVVPWGGVNELGIWNVDDGLWMIDPRPQLDGALRGVSFGTHPVSGRPLVATVTAGGVTDDQKAQIWDLLDGKEVGSVKESRWLFACSFSPDGRHLLLGGQRLLSRLWDWRTGEAVGPEFEHPKVVGWNDFIPETPWVASSDAAGFVQFWDPRTGRVVAPPVATTPPGSGGQNMVWNPRITADGKTVIATAFGLNALTVSDISSLHLPPADERLSDEDMLLLAEIAAGAQIVEGGIFKFSTTDEWLERWREFRRRHPDYHQLPEPIQRD